MGAVVPDWEFTNDVHEFCIHNLRKIRQSTIEPTYRLCSEHNTDQTYDESTLYDFQGHALSKPLSTLVPSCGKAG